MRTIKCPICKGKGTLDKPKEKDEAKIKNAMAKTLVEQGYSYRQVMRFLKWKSTYSVISALKK